MSSFQVARACEGPRSHVDVRCRLQAYLIFRADCSTRSQLHGISNTAHLCLQNELQPRITNRLRQQAIQATRAHHRQKIHSKVGKCHQRIAPGATRPRLESFGFRSHRHTFLSYQDLDEQRSSRSHRRITILQGWTTAPPYIHHPRKPLARSQRVLPTLPSPDISSSRLHFCNCVCLTICPVCA